MSSFYIYSFRYRQESQVISATVIFCSESEIDEKVLQSEIREFYEEQYQTDEVYIVSSSNNKHILEPIFIDRQDETFKGIPKRQETSFSESLYLTVFDKDGNLECVNGKQIPEGFTDKYINEGLQQIFVRRGGLIVSEDSHHYVFPSGKHCDRFLRTGNILIYSAEIFFIAFSLLKHFKEEQFTKIYCDTSSINSIAFALFTLKNSFPGNQKQVIVESFSSYEGLYKNPNSYTKDSFLLISASTSSNIIRYILDRHDTIERDNIVVLYFLGASQDYSNVKDQVLCNLTKGENNETGIEAYETYKDSDCEFCKKGSFAVQVSGDVFLLESPKINKVLLGVKDREKNLSDFVNNFKSRKRTESVLRVHYKEGSANKYEVYIDVAKIIKSIEDRAGLYDKYKGKLNDYINQYIPGSTKYLLCLNDEGSKALGEYILGQIKIYYNDQNMPQILTMDEIGKIDHQVQGTVVVVGSCISNGKNLLYISRALRQYDQLMILYFIGFARTVNNHYLLNLRNNLTMGKYGQDTNVFVAVETIYCSNCSKDSPWLAESEFLKVLMLKYDEDEKYRNIIDWFKSRIKVLNEASGDAQKGMAEELFFMRLTTAEPEPLRLRKNFAFWSFHNYTEHITHSDVYFTISNILNSLRNSGSPEKELRQAVYVRNLLDPANFNRFNDGIIQASLLRAAKAEEMAYSIDTSISQEMYNILETIISYHEEEQGEALPEFLYAIASKKMSLKKTHLTSIVEKVRMNCKQELFHLFADYIEEIYLN